MITILGKEWRADSVEEVLEALVKTKKLERDEEGNCFMCREVRGNCSICIVPEGLCGKWLSILSPTFREQHWNTDYSVIKRAISRVIRAIKEEQESANKTTKTASKKA